MLIILFLAVMVMSAFQAMAQDDLRQICGDPPVVKDESLKSYVEAKGGVFSKRIADASITASIETTAHDVFSKYPNADRSRISEKLLNAFCYAIMGSTELSAKEKIDYWFKVKRDFDVVSVERLGKITDQNDYFVTEVSSAKRARDGSNTHMGKQPGAGPAAVNRQARHRRLHHRLAAPAGERRADAQHATATAPGGCPFFAA